MTDRAKSRILLAALLVFGAVVFLTGIDWGLPSCATDPFLFGDREPWTAQQILRLAPHALDESHAADVDVNPLDPSSQPVALNETDAQRAEIVRRYRLFSFQPDEFITFSALSQMKPGRLQLDPQLYQYGGLWIYPVGALVKLGSILGLVPLRGDIAFYLDHPSAFGRFYVIARLYSVAWGLLGVWAVFWIAKHITGSLIAAAAATACYICMPVVVNMSHEAKPHLPGAVIMLCAIIAATKFVESGKRQWWIMTAILCGAAAGMVLSSAIIIVIIPLMVLLRRDPWPRRVNIALLGILFCVGVYFATNPYVGINLLINRAVLRSNFANTAAMYEFGRLGEGLVNAIKLIREGTSLGVALCGLVGLVVWLARRPPENRNVPFVLLLAVAALVLAQLVGLGAGKPGEYGRFALLPDITLAIVAASAIGAFTKRTVDRVALALLLVALTAFPSWFYLRGFIQDASPQPTRFEDARWLRMLQRAGARTLAVYAEPAPYSLPPVDLFHWNLVLLPRGFDIARDPIDADVIIRAVDAPGPNGATAGKFVRQSLLGPADAFPTRISWAAKPFEVWVRPELIERLKPATRESRNPNIEIRNKSE